MNAPHARRRPLEAAAGWQRCRGDHPSTALPAVLIPAMCHGASACCAATRAMLCRSVAPHEQAPHAAAKSSETIVWTVLLKPDGCKRSLSAVRLKPCGFAVTLVLRCEVIWWLEGLWCLKPSGAVGAASAVRVI